MKLTDEEIQKIFENMNPVIGFRDCIKKGAQAQLQKLQMGDDKMVEEIAKIIGESTIFIKANLLPLFKAQAEEIFKEIICPMCYRLNPHHVSMDNGEGCHWCQEKDNWCGKSLWEGK